MKITMSFEMNSRYVRHCPKCITESLFNVWYYWFVGLFQKLQKHAVEQKYVLGLTTVVGEHPENKLRNRYLNIILCKSLSKNEV